METWFCPPLAVIGSAEITQLAGLRSGLSCKTQPVAESGHAKPMEPGVAFVMPTMGTKFAMSARFEVALKEKLLLLLTTVPPSVQPVN